MENFEYHPSVEHTDDEDSKLLISLLRETSNLIARVLSQEERKRRLCRGNEEATKQSGGKKETCLWEKDHSTGEHVGSLENQISELRNFIKMHECQMKLFESHVKKLEYQNDDMIELFQNQLRNFSERSDFMNRFVTLQRNYVCLRNENEDLKKENANLRSNLVQKKKSTDFLKEIERQKTEVLEMRGEMRDGIDAIMRQNEQLSKELAQRFQKTMNEEKCVRFSIEELLSSDRHSDAMVEHYRAVSEELRYVKLDYEMLKEKNRDLQEKLKKGELRCKHNGKSLAEELGEPSNHQLTAELQEERAYSKNLLDYIRSLLEKVIEQQPQLLEKYC